MPRQVHICSSPCSLGLEPNSSGQDGSTAGVLVIPSRLRLDSEGAEAHWTTPRKPASVPTSLTSESVLLSPPGTCTTLRRPSRLGRNVFLCHRDSTSSNGALLDHFIRPPQHRRRDRQAERLRSLEVDDKLKLGGLLDGEVCRLRTLQDLVDQGGGVGIHAGEA